MGGKRKEPAALPPDKIGYPLYRRLGGPHGRSGRVRKISPPPRFEPQTFQPITNRYTGWAIAAHLYRLVGKYSVMILLLLCHCHIWHYFNFWYDVFIIWVEFCLCFLFIILLFVFIWCTLSVTSHLAFDSSRHQTIVEFKNYYYCYYYYENNTTSCMRGINTYIPETNLVPEEYTVLSLLFMTPMSLVPALVLTYFYVSTFRSMCAVSNMAVFCSSITSWFPGMVLTYFLNYYWYRMTLVFTFHVRCISIVRSLYFRNF
jgi:hypothetical protein